MAEVKMKEVYIKDIFINKRGNSKYTKKYCNQNQGEYEVYTGTTLGSFGFINTYDYEGCNLTYTTDGENAGTLKILDGKYNVGGHRAILFPITDNLNLEYFKITLQPIFFLNIRRGDIPSISWRVIQDLKVSVPIDKYGNYDFFTQSKIVEKHNAVEIKKKELQSKLDYINKVEIDFINNSKYNYKFFKVKEIFDLSVSTNSSKFTKTFIKKNSGNIPVYGASKEDYPSYGYVRDNAVVAIKKNGKTIESKILYFEDTLTYNIDGLAGYIFYRTGKFSLSEKVRPLIIKNEFKNQLDPLFLKYILEPLFRLNVKGRLGENGKNEYTKINQKMIENIEIKIPVDKFDNIDLHIQKDIVKKYKNIEEIKKHLNDKIEEVLSIQINF